MDQQQIDILLHTLTVGTLEDVRRELEALDPAARQPLVEAVWPHSIALGDLAKIELLTEFGGSPSDEDLFSAIRYQHPEVLAWLLDLGADVRTHEEYDRTLLMVAAASGCAACVKLLIERGAPVDEIAGFGEDALCYASTIETARLLVETGVDINRFVDDFHTPLKMASEEGNIEKVRILLTLGADPNLDRLDETPLFPAVKDDNVEMVKLLLDAGADPNIGTAADGGDYPIQFTRSLETLNLLLDAKVDLHTRNSFTGKYSVDDIQNPEVAAVVAKLVEKDLKKHPKHSKRSKHK